MTYEPRTLQKGAYYEKIASVYLEQYMGYDILELNFKCRFGEIDIIAKDEDTLVFVEVKYRENDKHGMPEEFCDIKKQKKILQTARVFMLKSHSGFDIPVRFDVVSILGDKIKVIKNAFSE
ncbi:MAG: YraN family protein [Lachnospiraceae bacterium]|nr:YraN family protein [Lachnospiraceae bacterium]